MALYFSNTSESITSAIRKCGYCTEYCNWVPTFKGWMCSWLYFFLTFYCAIPFLVSEKVVLQTYVWFSALCSEAELVRLERKDKNGSCCFLKFAIPGQIYNNN